MATKTQNESTMAATAIAAAPSATPATSNGLAPMRSTRNPAGVCNSAVTTLKATKAKPSSV
jgi:hypothetical protein